MSYDNEARLSTALQDIVGDRPYAPDLDQIESRGRKLRHRRVAWRATAGTGFVAAIAAVAVAATGIGGQAPAPSLAAPNSATSGATAGTAQNGQLVQLAGYLTAAKQPAGDATLVLRDQVYTNGLKVDVWDLHADNGDDYFAQTRGALPEQVTGKHLQADEAGRKQAVAAAKYAAKGDLNEARKRMADAYEPKNPKVAPPAIEAPGTTPSLSPETKKKLAILKEDPSEVGNLTDNGVWNNSIDALMDGAGSPTVRAGVLRLLGQMPEVTVAKGTLDGQPVLALTAGQLATGDGNQTLTINADTGLPVKYVATGVTVNYTVTRVTIADVASGKF